MIDVKLDNLSKAYTPGQPVLTDIAADIPAGELFFLLGPSGCGKSTLLRIIAGFVEPDQGRVFFGDKDITALSPEKRSAAMVFQSYALWPHMTVAENVAFGLDVQGTPAADKEKRVADALSLVGLEAYGDRKVPSLSGGQQQRVAVARAVVVRPDVLLLDEPLSNLDAKLRATMRSELRRICKEAGLTTIYVTHDQKEALTMADRLAVMHKGLLQQIGTPREVYQRPANRFVADFIGESNFVNGKVVGIAGDGVAVETSLGTLHSKTGGCDVGKSVTVLIRPESFIPDYAGDENRVTGGVIDGMFLGESGSWQCRAGETLFQVLELRPASRQPGDTVSFHIPPEHVVILPEE